MTLTGRRILAFVALFFSTSLLMAEVAVPPLVARVTDLSGYAFPDGDGAVGAKTRCIRGEKG